MLGDRKALTARRGQREDGMRVSVVESTIPVQEHLRHADIQTTTIYTRLTQTDLQKVVSVFDTGVNSDSDPDTARSEFGAEKSLKSSLVAPTGFDEGAVPCSLPLHVVAVA
jgi:hypothetical protein